MIRPSFFELIFQRYEKNGQNRMQLQVWYTTHTVGSALDHPVQGKTQLFRQAIDFDTELEDLFKNPRKHTGRGYQTRWYMFNCFLITKYIKINAKSLNFKIFIFIKIFFII